MRAAIRSVLVIAVVLCSLRIPALGLSPMETVRTFCRSDGRGERIRARTWNTIALLIDWSLEPAWDHVVLIDGYQVSDAAYPDADTAIVTVTYQIAADVEAGKVTHESREEKRTLRLAADESRTWWRIVGPPPVPHVFATQVEEETMAASLDPSEGEFVSAAAFVQHYLVGAGWDIATFSVRGAPALEALSEVRTPAIGDIVLYYDGDVPYHVGVLESEDAVLSATLNGGIRRTPLDAFAGTVHYRRPRASARVLTPTPVSTPTKARAPAKRQPKR